MAPSILPDLLAPVLPFRGVLGTLPAGPGEMGCPPK